MSTSETVTTTTFREPPPEDQHPEQPTAWASATDGIFYSEMELVTNLTVYLGLGHLQDFHLGDFYQANNKHPLILPHFVCLNQSGTFEPTHPPTVKGSSHKHTIGNSQAFLETKPPQ